MALKIPFNKPFIAGRELFHVAHAVTLGNIAGDGHFTQQCSQVFESTYGIDKVLMTPSCTAALEMAAILGDLGPGDEVIMPSFTFVSTANAVVRTGARPVFVDIRADTLNLDEKLIESAITSKTKAILPVHYAGVACEMDRIMAIADEHDLLVIEDAAQGVNSFYNGRALGSIGHLGCYSFHETKNYICGEGGALCINDPRFVERAEILRDKGTNRQQFFRGQVDKYTWVDVGSSYVPSEIACAFLYGQLELLEPIAEKRRKIYEFYRQGLGPLESKGVLQLPYIPPECESNFHMFYVILPDGAARDGLMDHLAAQGIHSVFHYVPLHNSPMGLRLGNESVTLPLTEDISGRLLRLPFYYDITEEEQARVVSGVVEYVKHIEPAVRVSLNA